jgi:hypothetical protein
MAGPDESHHIFQVLQIVDYLITIYNIEEVIHNYGWLVFVEKSPINTIVECKCVVDAHNFKDVWEKLKYKAKLILKNL